MKKIKQTLNVLIINNKNLIMEDQKKSLKHFFSY